MNKDESLHRLLRRTSGARAGARAQGACLDAETLAAWTDGSLTARERAAAETHAADCDRCLAVLAAIAKTTPPPSKMERPLWLSVRWLVSLTTAAVAITTWVLVQGPLGSQRSVPSPATPAVDAVKPAVQPERELRSQTRVDEVEKRVAPPPVPSRSRDQAESRRSAESNPKESTVILDKVDAPAQVPTPASEPRPASPPPAAAASAPAQPLPRAEASNERFQSQTGAVAQLPPVIISPDPDIRWRIVGPSVERSTDGGRTWHAQSTDTALELLAGSSPATLVCWIVGRSGTVLLSTDGETWRRLDFPDARVDLVAVSARDEMAATVTAADGRRYRTTDAGGTWTLQENPAAPF